MASSLTILGSGTLVPSARHHSAAHLIRTPGASLLLDCGSGTLHGLDRYGVEWPAITHVAVSHFHNDHVADLLGLLIAFKHGLRPSRTAPVTLLGPRGFDDFLHGLAAAQDEDLEALGFEIHVVEVGPGNEFTDAGFTLTAHPTPHTEESLAYRWTGQGAVVGYTGDTGPSEDVAAFLAGCDVLVAECSLPDPLEMDTHLSPRTLAEMARTATPEHLVVTHVYPPLSPEEAVERIRGAGFGGTLTAGYDGLVVPLAEG